MFNQPQAIKSIKSFLNKIICIDRLIITSYIKQCQDLISGDLLDVGCGASPYKKYFKNLNSYTGIDLQNNADIHHNLNEFPYPIKNASTIVSYVPKYWMIYPNL